MRALAVGPMVLHAFSLFPGGAIYAAPAITGTDQDCDLRAHPNQSPSRGGTVEADRRAVLTLSAGEVACLVTQTKGSFELLWHAAMAAPPASAKMAAVPAAAR